MLKLLLVAAGIALAVSVYFMLNRNAAKARAERRKRYAIPETGPRVPLAEPRPPTSPLPTITEIPAATGAAASEVVTDGTPIFDPSLATQAIEGLVLPPEEPSLDMAPLVTGRLVNTPDGEMIVTTPPFRVKDHLLGKRETAYARAITRRLPRGMVLCPKVRLESLLTPTPPDGRDPDDWRTWRRRVRMRAVDFVICDARAGNWKPVLAIEVDRPMAATRKIGGGVDRMIDEVLLSAGLPFIRCTGEPDSDWGMIEPYVRQTAVA